MSDYSVFKVQIAKKGTKCCHSLRRKGLSFQVVADEKGVLGSDFKNFFEKFFLAAQLDEIHRSG